MKKLMLIVSLCVLANIYVALAQAKGMRSIDSHNVMLCPSSVVMVQDQKKYPSFTEPSCYKAKTYQIDPQNKQIWMQSSIHLSAEFLADKSVMAVYIFGKTSSEVYFNGHYLGRNGTPSHISSEEFPGRMDTKFRIPPEVIFEGENELVLSMSSHHGFLSLRTPVNYIGIGEDKDIQHVYYTSLLISLPLLGILVLGAIYFLAISLYAKHKKNNLLFLLMALFAIGQLFAEISRGLFTYSYPMHDVRLLSVVVCSLGFGLCLLLYVVRQLAPRLGVLWIGVGLIMSLVAVVLFEGFDAKAALAILLPVLVSAVLSLYKYWETRDVEYLVLLTVFVAFIVTIALTFHAFHELAFFYIIALMMGFLFIRQAYKLAREQAKCAMQQQEVDKLTFRLKQNAQIHSPTKLRLSSAGKIELIDSNLIAYCKAAGDYVEIHQTNGKQSLYSGSLKSVESQLPLTFLKVHRSYIVNLDHVKSLTIGSLPERSPANGSYGVLSLIGDIVVPVSRRFVPSVREMVG